ncbi:hypothetical protein FRC14_004883 [Serendipita sp. 396]|nr:hypothetical protein FRC14_004883 [Serendipita sp. 396]KAG8866396.1 hypothetical protein FRC20_008647 [Serendipita sp. 405]
MRGVSLTEERSIGVCEMVDVPMGGITTLAHFYIFLKSPFDFILGQPWIRDHLIAQTETGTVSKMMIRNFLNPSQCVTIILQNESKAKIEEIEEEEVSAAVATTESEECRVAPDVFS